MNPWVDPRLKDVRPEQARAYMLSHGWKQTPFPRPEVWRFEGPPDDDGQPIPLFVPSEPLGSDYEQRIYDLVTTLAILEDRYAVAVLTDMLGATNGQPPPKGTGRGRGAAARA